MVNKNTLIELNKYAFGANINKLEISLKAFKQLENLRDMSVYYPLVKKQIQLLRELKPDSKVFSDDFAFEEIEKTRFENLLGINPVENIPVVYDINSDELIEYKSNITDDTDITAITNIAGLDISVTFINGILYKVFLISEDKLVLELTQRLKHILPSKIDELSKYQLVDIRMKLTLQSHVNIDNNGIVECYIMSMINRGISEGDLDKLRLISYDIFIDSSNEELPYNTYWDKLEYIESLGLKVVNSGLILSVNSDSIKQAILDLDEYFSSMDDIDYKYNGIIIVNNEYKIGYDGYNLPDTEIFESTVKNIEYVYEEDGIFIKLNIVDTLCNNRRHISSIILDDACDIEKADIHIGKKVKFCIKWDNASVVYD